jgi:hypothetical protein
VSAVRRHLWRSAGAIFAGVAAVVALSLGIDQILHVLGVYPPWGQPMFEPGLNLLALAYRSGITILGGYLTARLAPRAPMGHVAILAGIGFVLSTVGAIVSIPLRLGPTWYPVALAVTGPIFTLLVGRWQVRRARERASGERR